MPRQGHKTTKRTSVLPICTPVKDSSCLPLSVDYSTLKRAQLQLQCKKLGLRATGKVREDCPRFLSYFLITIDYYMRICICTVANSYVIISSIEKMSVYWIVYSKAIAATPLFCIIFLYQLFLTQCHLDMLDHGYCFIYCICTPCAQCIHLIMVVGKALWLYLN